jgi:drug/metabolite transporter (DMT)-like permease
MNAMKLSKLSHVLSVLLGLTGVILWAVAILASPVFGQTRETMLLCAISSLLTAIWLVLGAMHHVTLEKAGEIV